MKKRTRHAKRPFWNVDNRNRLGWALYGLAVLFGLFTLAVIILD